MISKLRFNRTQIYLDGMSLKLTKLQITKLLIQDKNNKTKIRFKEQLQISLNAPLTGPRFPSLIKEKLRLGFKIWRISFLEIG